MVGAELTWTDNDDAARAEIGVEESTHLRSPVRLARKGNVECNILHARIGAAVGEIGTVILSLVDPDRTWASRVDAELIIPLAKPYPDLPIDIVPQRLPVVQPRFQPTRFEQLLSSIIGVVRTLLHEPQCLDLERTVITLTRATTEARWKRRSSTLALRP